MSQHAIPHGAKKCNAYARSTGETCKQYALANGKCHYHGGKTPIKHGLYTKKSTDLRKRVNALIRKSNQTIQKMLD